MQIHGEFTIEHLEDVQSGDDYFHCGVSGTVVKHKVLELGDEQLITQNMYLGMLFLRDDSSNKWYPRSIQNTVLQNTI